MMTQRMITKNLLRFSSVVFVLMAGPSVFAQEASGQESIYLKCSRDLAKGALNCVPLQDEGEISSDGDSLTINRPAADVSRRDVAIFSAGGGGIHDFIRQGLEMLENQSSEDGGGAIPDQEAPRLDAIN